MIFFTTYCIHYLTYNCIIFFFFCFTQYTLHFYSCFVLWSCASYFSLNMLRALVYGLPYLLPFLSREFTSKIRVTYRRVRMNNRRMVYGVATRGRTERLRSSRQSKMAGASDWFSIGSTVVCKTCHDKEIEGEVMAFDPQTKMLILSILLKKNSNVCR